MALPQTPPIRRDPRTGESATDPVTSRADDPTHGVGRSGRPRTAPANDPLVTPSPAHRGAMQAPEGKGRAARSFLLFGVIALLVLIGLAAWMWGGAYA